MQWYVAVVPAQKEFAVRDRLKELGYEVMLPVEKKWRRRSRHCRKRVEVEMPFLPRYVFVGCAGQLPWWHLNTCPLIQGFLGYDGYPKPLPPEAVRALEGLSFAIPTFNPHKSIRAGDEVQFAAGPLHGKIARVRKIVSKRARVLIEVFSSMREIEVPLEILEAA